MPKTMKKNEAKTTKKVAPKAVKTAVIKASAPKASKEAAFSLSVFSMDGTKKGTVALSKEIFGAKVNDKLMAQAVRVYLVNQRQGTASTKTRGEVSLTNAKWYRQKGTGRARHGAKSAPIFVGGGVAHGPQPRNFELKMSKKMRRLSLFSALSSKLLKEGIVAIDAESASGKTKEVIGLFSKLNMLSKEKNANKVLFVASAANAIRAAKNIKGTNVIPAVNLNTYEVLNSNYIVFDKNSIDEIEKAFLSKN